MIDKSRRIIDTVTYLQEKYGANHIPINDHWENDQDAIGLTDETGQYLAYISTNDNDNDYYLALENPPVDDDLPYSDAGDFNNICLAELEQIVVKHLHLTI